MKPVYSSREDRDNEQLLLLTHINNPTVLYRYYIRDYIFVSSTRNENSNEKI